MLSQVLFVPIFQEKMSWTVADAVDYKGFPADKSKTGGWVPAALILGLYYSLLPLPLFSLYV